MEDEKGIFFSKMIDPLMIGLAKFIEKDLSCCSNIYVVEIEIFSYTDIELSSGWGLHVVISCSRLKRVSSVLRLLLIPMHRQKERS